jgi:hypothetical protein
MTIPVRTLIEEITNALNKDKTKIGDILYFRYVLWGISHENTWEITDIVDNLIKMKLIRTTSRLLELGRIVYVRYPEHLKYYSRN